MSMAGPTGRESVMKQTIKALLVTCGALASALGIGAGTTPAQAQGKTITLCWAAWDPANALVELSKDFTAKTGIGMKFEFVPWTSFADRFLNELNSKGKLCDVLIGDSQWIGGSAENGHYVKLNEFFDKNGISMKDFMPATVLGYSEWPKNTPNYYALPAMGDAVGWTYRKDWFSRPGGDPRAIPLLLATGLRSLSMAPALVGGAKLAVAAVDLRPVSESGPWSG